MEHHKGNALWARAERVLAGGFQTLSKNPNRFPLGAAPKFLSYGQGCHVWDEDGHRYIDLVAGLGPILLGHRDPVVESAVRAQLEKGVSFSLGTRLEVEVAELLCVIIPSAEMVRFAKNGADVTNAAIKLARYATGRPHVIYCGYHGGHDSYLSTTDNSGGILHDIKPYNHQIMWGDLSGLRATMHRVNVPDGGVRGGLAAIIAEVPPPIYGEEDTNREFMLALRHAAHSVGAIFILDEVVTGFRRSVGGAQSYYGVFPDLSCFSKAMGNGHAVSAIVGDRHLMKHFENGKVFLSTTFGGETIGLAAAKATIQVLRGSGPLEAIHYFGEMLGDGLLSLLNSHRDVPAALLGDSCRMLVKFSDIPGLATADELKTLWLQEMIERGILAGGPIFPMACYTKDVVDQVLEAASQTLDVMSRVIQCRDVRGAIRSEVARDVFGSRYESFRAESQRVLTVERRGVFS
ncbi:MAG TPA: aminotransferase class III-fold pyridoxal phosphate-dependent enzyme [Alphaproteobacteria bacterium]|nr:aminotransferase class III-fold pyridoxal phosphate-dependent enzyme [Alphaproteobacteria bacterium]